MRWELWRQDDNGNHFLIGSYPDLREAEHALTRISRHKHKQTYWIEPISDGDGQKEA
jgi:hypothetical protein